MLEYYIMGFVNKGKRIVFAFGALAILTYIAINVFSTSFNLRNVSRMFRQNSTRSEKVDNAVIDVDLTDNPHGKAQRDQIKNSDKSGKVVVSVAVGLAITSRGFAKNSSTNDMEIFRTFLPSFCKTASTGFAYIFYIAYDHSDELFRFARWRTSFLLTFNNITKDACQPREINVSGVRFVACPYEGKPTWAQNDALQNAYLDDVEYFYRVNDDTEFTTVNWTEKFVDALIDYDPPNLGAVGPTHRNGNTDILTYDFVHRTHVDVFGFYYPRMFVDWSGDMWITNVYKPDRSRKLTNIFLTHTMRLLMRYNAHPVKELQKHYRLSLDKKIVQRYVGFKRQPKQISNRNGSTKNVISMTLVKNKPKYVWGAIRNAQLAPVLFPNWTLRIYIPSRSSSNANVTEDWNVEPRVVSTLRRLGAEIVYVESNLAVYNSSVEFINFLVIDDPDVDYFLIRNCERRLSERDAIAVADWTKRAKENETIGLHCLRDHPMHVKQPLVPGLWGGRTKSFRERLDCSFSDILVYISGKDVDNDCSFVKSLTSNSSFDRNGKNTKFGGALQTNDTEGQGGYQSTLHLRTGYKEKIDPLREVIWPLMYSAAYCHDSVSCLDWTGTHPFPDRRENEEYLGRTYDTHQEPVDDVDFKSNENPECLK